MVVFLIGLLPFLVSADFIFNEADYTKTAYEAACTAGGGEYQESNSEACPGLIFTVDPVPSPQE